MNRVITLILVGGAVFLIILFVNRPDLLDQIWLWLIGLSGTIIQAFKSLIEYFKEKKEEPNSSKKEGEVIKNKEIEVRKKKEVNKNKKPLVITNPYPKLPISLIEKTEDLDGCTLTLLRCFDDGKTTIGWLYLDGEFYCYTLEDTFREVKVKNETRIPSGTFTIDFNRYDTKKTLKYREKFKPWFRYHLQLKNVPNFGGIYIHNGGDYTHTSGCILVSDSLVVTEKEKFLNNSKNTFERLYSELSEKIEDTIPVRIVIMDENWMKHPKI